MTQASNRVQHIQLRDTGIGLAFHNAFAEQFAAVACPVKMPSLCHSSEQLAAAQEEVARNLEKSRKLQRFIPFDTKQCANLGAKCGFQKCPTM